MRGTESHSCFEKRHSAPTERLQPERFFHIGNGYHTRFASITGVGIKASEW